MERKNSYHTKQKNIILDIIREYSDRFSIYDIYEKTNGVGLTTVYRCINKLVSQGKLIKEIDNNNQVYYYLIDCECEHHFYLKCMKCEKMIHIDCDFIYELYNHILDRHGFIIDKNNLVINGLCKECGGELDE